MAEIENCPSCYLNANTKKDTWFVEACPKPHLLLWAKLKGKDNNEGKRKISKVYCCRIPLLAGEIDVLK